MKRGNKKINSFDFRKTNWGMNKSQVKKIEEENISKEDINLLVYLGKAFNTFNSYIIYEFSKDKLTSASYIFVESRLDPSERFKDYRKIKKILIKTYGEPTKDKQCWKNNLYKENYRNWGLAINRGHLSYDTSWDTSATKICLHLFGENYKNYLGIRYISKKLGEKNLKKTILLFSGGKDSFLSACYLIEKGFRIFMVTFENGAGLQAYNSEHGAKRIIERYGEDRVSFLGVQCIAGIWREFFLPYFNMKPSDIINNFGELTISQFHCLTCRSSMYIWSIIMAQQMGIKYIAEGARHCQAFVIELPIMINKFREFLSKYSIKLLLPIYNLESDWERKNLLLLRGFVPKTLEPQCLIGVPLPNNASPDQDIQLATLKYFEKIIVPRAERIIKEQAKSSLLIKKDLL